MNAYSVFKFGLLVCRSAFHVKVCSGLRTGGGELCVVMKSWRNLNQQGNSSMNAEPYWEMSLLCTRGVKKFAMFQRLITRNENLSPERAETNSHFSSVGCDAC